METISIFIIRWLVLCMQDPRHRGERIGTGIPVFLVPTLRVGTHQLSRLDAYLWVIMVPMQSKVTSKRQGGGGHTHQQGTAPEQNLRLNPNPRNSLSDGPLQDPRPRGERVGDELLFARL